MWLGLAIGGIVGASGLLTQIMRKAMNRSLISTLFGSTSKKSVAVLIRSF